MPQAPTNQKPKTATTKNLTVVLRSEPANPHICFAAPHFRAAPGDIVDFQFPEQPDADIIFMGASPFGTRVFKPGRQTVRTDAPSRSYGYLVQWESAGGGNGNGGGEVP
jgi:hypothetical protein